MTASFGENCTVHLWEPQLTYPLGSGATRYFTIYLDESDTSKFATDSTSAQVLHYTGSTTNFGDNNVSYIDSSNVIRTKANFVSEYGTIVEQADRGTIQFSIPAEPRLATVTIGSEAASTETSTAELGGDAVAIGGVDISVTGTAAGLSLDEWPMPVAKVDSDVTAADKTNKNLILVGGPVVNSLTAALTDKMADAGCDITNTAPGAGKGRVCVIDDAFTTGKYAVVVAGSDRKGTTAAAQLLQTLDTFTDTDAAVVTVEYVSAGEAPTAVAEVAEVVEE